jgi:DNA-directed RNA polymerase specialized sigma24 family protein
VTKERLRAYRDIKLERDKLAAMIEELEVVLYGPRTQKMDGMPRGGSGDSSRVEEAVIRHDELLERYRAKVAELSAALAEIENAIEVLEPRERTLIRLYYAQGLTWEEVCVAMSYSWKQIHRIHGAALEALKSEKATE